MRVPRALILPALYSTLSLAPTSAYGQAANEPIEISEERPEATRAAARELMAVGRAQRQAGNHEAALDSFSKAHALMMVPTTLYEVAATEVALGRLLKARETLAELRDMKEAPADPAPFKRARQAAAKLSGELEARIPTLQIVFHGLADDADPELLVDGEPAAFGADKRRIEVDPGTHILKATTPSGSAEATVTAKEGERRQVDLEFPAQAADVSNSPAPAQAEEDPERIHEAKGTDGTTIAVYALGGLALAGLGAGATFAILGRNENVSLIDSCAPACSEQQVDQVRKWYTAANISFGVSVASTATALILYAFRPTSSAKQHGSSSSARDIAFAVEPQQNGALLNAAGQF